MPVLSTKLDLAALCRHAFASPSTLKNKLEN